MLFLRNKALEGHGTIQQLANLRTCIGPLDHALLVLIFCAQHFKVCYNYYAEEKPCCILFH